MPRLVRVLVYTPEEALAAGHDLMAMVEGSGELCHPNDTANGGSPGYVWVRAIDGGAGGARLDFADRAQDLLARHSAEWAHSPECACEDDGLMGAVDADQVIVTAQRLTIGTELVEEEEASV